MGKAVGNVNSKYVTRATQISEKEWLEESEQEYAPFSYPPFTPSKVTKKPVIITCVLIVVIGFIIYSAVIQAFPWVKTFSEALHKETLTAEEEAAADSATVKILISFGVCLGVIAALAVAGAFTVKRVILKKALSGYESAKASAQSDWEKGKADFLETKKLEREAQIELLQAMTCKFCGGELQLDIDPGTMREQHYTEKVYNVKVTGYDSATVSPDYKTHSWQKRMGQGISCSCPVCKYKIEKRDESDPLIYSTNIVKSVKVNPNGKITKADVEKTKAYEYVSRYSI